MNENRGMLQVEGGNTLLPLARYLSHLETELSQIPNRSILLVMNESLGNILFYFILKRNFINICRKPHEWHHLETELSQIPNRSILLVLYRDCIALHCPHEWDTTLLFVPFFSLFFYFSIVEFIIMFWYAFSFI